MPKNTADENSNHNHLIIEDNSFTVQLTFSDGNCSSSIYLLAFHLCFVSKTLSFCFRITCIHVCWSYCFFMTFGHSKLVKQQKCNYWLGLLSPPSGHFCFTATQLPISASPPTLGNTGLYHRRTRRLVGGLLPPAWKFSGQILLSGQAQAAQSCWMIKKYFNPVKIFRANSIFRTSASCSKFLNNKKYFKTVKNFRATLFFQRKLLKNPEW